MRKSGSKLAEVRGGWRNLYNEEINKVYSSPNLNWIVRNKRDETEMKCAQES